MGTFCHCYEWQIFPFNLKIRGDWLQELWIFDTELDFHNLAKLFY
jgi:hypothetical protein